MIKSTLYAMLAGGLLSAAGLAHAQNNAPLTGGMAGSAPQAVMAQAAAARPAVAQAAVAQPVPPAAGTITDRPVVRQVASPMPVPAAPAAPAAAQAAGAAADSGPGELTRALLAAQADGRRAGPALPMQGPVATAAWDRYLDSFRRPIPEWFRERVEQQTAGN